MFCKPKSNSYNAEDVYFRLLEIGAECSHKGLILETAIDRLNSEGYLKNTNDAEHIEVWYSLSFEHREKGCLCPDRSENDCGCDGELNECDTFEHHQKCKHYLTSDAITRLSQIKQSKQSNKQIELLQTQINNQNSQIETAKEVAKSSSRLAKFALFSSIGILALNSYNSLFKENPLKYSLEQSVSTQQQNQQLVSQAFLNLYRLDSIYLQHQLDNKKNQPNYLELEKTLKLINWKLLKIKENITDAKKASE